MNSFDKFLNHLKECEACVYYAKIIELEEVPEEKLSNFRHYNIGEDLLLYCCKCDIYLLLPTDCTDR